MNQKPINLTVLGLDIAFRPGADMDRAGIAARLVEERYAEQKLRSQGAQTKDIILTFVALGLADELLQMKIQQGRMQKRLQSLLAKIEKSL